MITKVIDAQEKRQIVVLDILNAFVFTKVTNLKANLNERVIVIVKKVSAKMSVLTFFDTHKDCVVCENEVSTICS